MSAPILSTARLTLACHAPDDLEELATMWAEPVVYAMIGGKPRTREEVWIRLLRSIGQWQAFGYGSWVLRDTATGRLVGELGLLEARRALTPPIDDAPEVGWTLSPWAHGQGYASEGLAAAFAWVDARGTPLTRCIIDPGNDPSIRLAQRFGFEARGEGWYHDKPTLIFERRAPVGAGDGSAR